MAQNEPIQERIALLIASNDVVLFMKGNRMMPQCGFSARAVQILDRLVNDYETVDVLEDPEIRNGIKEYSQWPTIPQLYLKGEFVGGSDIIAELYSSGELHEKLGLAKPAPPKTPTIHVSDAAAKRVREYMERNPGGELHLTIDARFQPSLGLGPREPHDIEAKSNGLSVLMDPLTAGRADGITIDVVETPTGSRFKIDNPNQPAEVKQITAKDLKKMMDEGAAFELYDVRTPQERAIARIEGARHLDQEAQQRLEGLPKSTPLVFHCHHGGRSQSAAEHFRELGFTNVSNVSGGIDAWSTEVDPKVPRY